MKESKLMKKVGIISLGCSKNLVDSEMILGLFKNKKSICFVNKEDYSYEWSFFIG